MKTIDKRHKRKYPMKRQLELMDDIIISLKLYRWFFKTFILPRMPLIFIGEALRIRSRLRYQKRIYTDHRKRITPFWMR